MASSDVVAVVAVVPAALALVVLLVAVVVAVAVASAAVALAEASVVQDSNHKPYFERSLDVNWVPVPRKWGGHPTYIGRSPHASLPNPNP